MRRLVLNVVYLGVIVALVGIMRGVADAQDTTVTGTIPLGKVTVLNIKSTSVEVSWETITDSSSQVFYDAVSHASKGEYANKSAPSATCVSSHVVVLVGLTPSKIYHFRVESVGDDFAALSEDNTFTTLPSGGSGGSASQGESETGSNTLSGITDLSPYLNISGVLVTTAVVTSDDGVVKLTISKGARGLTADGRELKSVGVVPASGAPVPPKNASLVSGVYKLSPDGARFNPPVVLAIAYDLAALPSGADERNLVMVTQPQTEPEGWVELNSVVDVSAHTVTASISQFSRYALLAHTSPALFSLSDLTISPAVGKAGGAVTVTARIANSGDLSGDYTAVLRINGETVSDSTMTVGGGGTCTVTFVTIPATAGEYEVDLGGLTGSFVAVPTGNRPLPSRPAFNVSDLTISPAEIEVGQTIAVSVLVTNTSRREGTYAATLEINNAIVDSKEIVMDGGAIEIVTFQVSESVPGSYVVDVGGVEGSFEVRPREAKKRRIPWWLLAISLLAVGGASVPFLRQPKKRDTQA